MYKKLLAGAAALIMVMGASVCPIISVADNFAVTASAETVKNDGTFNYQVINGKSVQITGLVNASKDTINIPAKIDGMPVTEIGSTAFYSKYHNMPLKKVTIPDTVVSIGDSAFAYCEALTEIKIPASVKSIGTSAFEGCVKLSAVKLSEGLESIGDKAFYWCERLPSVTIPASVTHIGEDISYCCGTADEDTANFYFNCYANTTGERYAFYNHVAYELLDPENSTSLVSKGVYKKTFMYELVNDGKEIIVTKGRLEDENIEIPDNIGGVPVTEIGEAAFYNKDHNEKNNVKTIKLPDTLKTIGASAFADNESLKEINIPKSVKTIGDKAFEVCTSLEKVTLPAGLESIGAQAFTWCTSLNSVIIPSSVKSIGQDAFNKCGTATGKNKFMIYCTKDSAGEKYAVDNNIKYALKAAGIKKGDANNDDKINVTDIAMIASHIKGIKALSNYQFNAADVNNDKKLTVTDIAMIAAHIKGIKAIG